jgi:N utilization substance protein B
MKQTRHQARIAALQGMYQLDVQAIPAAEETGGWIEYVLKETETTGETADYARRLVAGAWAKREQYDEMITGVSDHWDVARMAVVDRNLLRLALYELLEQPDVPARVAIDEAIELGREFGSAESAHFINGVLDAICKKDPACKLARGDELQRKPASHTT